MAYQRRSRALVGAAVLAGVLLALPAVANAQDLYIKTFQVGVSGTTVTYQATLCNAGSSTTRAFDLEVYYNRTSAPGCYTVQSETYRFTSGLSSGSCVTRTFTRTGASSGTFRAWARADADCEVSETNESNNNRYDNYTVGGSAPDLYVKSFSTSTSGTTVTYSATVCNGGGSTSRAFDLEFYYDSTSTPGCSTIQNRTFRFSSGLSRGSCSTKTFSRSGVSTGTYIGWARVDADCEVTESNELNNNKASVYSVKPSKPDLYITSFSAAVSGSSVTYRATICNGGATTTSSFDLEFYYDRSTAPGCTSYASRDISITGGLAAGKCTTKSYTRTGAASGSYTAWARVDADCKVAESNESNNNAYDSYKVGPTLPDLRISKFTVSVSGTTATYVATICNDGAAVSKAFNLEVYYDLSSAPGCYTGYSRNYRFSSLASGSCSTRTFVRSGVSSGSYTAWARADANCEVTESSETNNNASASYSVGKPDLYVSNLNVSVNGTTVTYQATVCNAGLSTSSAFTIGLFYNQSTTPTCSTSTNQTYTLSSGLASGKCYTRTFTRTGAAYGQYTAAAMVDSGCKISESKETNNTSSTKYTVGPTQPNLYVKSFTVTVSGTSVSYAVEVCNKGAATKSAFDIEVYYDRVSAPGCNSSESRTYNYKSGLAYDKCYTHTFNRTGVAAGTYLGWARADGDCDVTESTETDNNMSKPYVVGAAAKPELYVSNFDATVSGNTVTYKVTVCNAGSKVSSFTAGLYYDSNSGPTCGGTAPNQSLSFSSGLDKGKCATQSYVRTGVTGGSYTGWAFVDPACKISETNENNNTATQAYTVVDSKPDLYISNFTVSESSGQLTYDVTVCNGGKAAASGFQVGLFQNRTGAPGCTDTPDATVNIGTLSASSCDTKKVTATAPSAGPYVAWALADAQCAVTETNENNNSSPAAYVVAAPPVDAGAQDAEIVPDGIVQDMGLPDAEINEEDAGPQADQGPDPQVDQGITTESGVIPPPQTGDDGCGCRVGAAPSSPAKALPLALLLLGLGLALIRRRK